MNTRIIFLASMTLLFFCTLFIQGAKRKVVVDFKAFEIENFYKELLQINYNINYAPQNISTLNANFTLTEEVKSITGDFNLRIRNGGNYFNFTGVEFDCKGMSAVYNHYMLNMVAGNLRTFSNFPLSCPFKKNKLYYLNGFKIVTNLIPSYLPDFTFETYATVSYNRQLLVRIKTGGQIRRRQL